nr:MAG TPA: hypothetical protein [Caudoviricetes sp.]
MILYKYKRFTGLSLKPVIKIINKNIKKLLTNLFLV